MIGRGPQIADAVVAQLVDPARAWNSDGALSTVRQYLAVYKAADFKSMKVTVSTTELETGDQTTAKNNRQTIQEQYTTSIMLQRKLTFVNELPVVAEVDSYDYLAEQIYDYFNNVGNAGAVSFLAAGIKWTVLKASRQLLNNIYTEHQWETQIDLLIVGWL